MEFRDFIQPKEITVTCGYGIEKQFMISKFPAVQGREIIAKYPISNIPKLADYPVSEDTMFKLMKFVAVKTGDIMQSLANPLLINQHVTDMEMLAKIEMASLEYNCSFLRNGRISSLLQEYALNTIPKILKTLMDSSAQSSPATKPA